jgi:ribosomal protein S18 acetylase RimI-like enzyme
MARFQIVEHPDGQAPDLEAQLYEFNAAATGAYDGVDLGFTIEEDGRLIAGLSGYTWGGIAEVRQLWVDRAHRGEGMGEALMRAAIAAAQARGCRFMFLSTHSFQAPGFYEALGFETVATLADKPVGHSEHWMRLRL